MKTHLLRFLLYFAILAAFALGGLLMAEVHRVGQSVWTALTFNDYAVIVSVTFLTALICVVCRAFEED